MAGFPTAEGTISELASRQAEGIGLKWSQAHNSFVQIAAELGIPGLVAFLMLLWNWYDQSRRIARSRQTVAGWCGEYSLAQALIGSIVGYMIAGFFLSQAYAAFLYSLIGIQVGFWATAGVRDADGAEAARTPRGRRALQRPQRPGAAPLPAR